MSKKITKKSTQEVAPNVVAKEEAKNEILYLSKQMKVDPPGNKLTNATTKEDFEKLFKEYNEHFITLSNEVTQLEIINDTIVEYISEIQKAMADKLGESDTEDEFSDLDSESIDGDDDEDENSEDPGELQKNNKKQKKKTTNENESTEKEIKLVEKKSTKKTPVVKKEKTEVVEVKIKKTSVPKKTDTKEPESKTKKTGVVKKIEEPEVKVEDEVIETKKKKGKK